MALHLRSGAQSVTDSAVAFVDKPLCLPGLWFKLQDARPAKRIRMAPVELRHPADAQQPAPAKQKVHEPKPVKTKFAELLSPDILKVHVDSGCASMTPALCELSFLDACDLPGHRRESNPSRGGAPTAACKETRRKEEISKSQRQGTLRLSFRFIQVCMTVTEAALQAYSKTTFSCLALRTR